jgi:RNA polymerase sigma factor (TIGR02999 family)
MTHPSHEVTQLLADWSGGDESALERLTPLVYEELRRIAARQMRRERVGHTLQTTALVHEAYLQLVGQKGTRWENRSHFYGVAASAMRRILVDYARQHNREKRGGQARKVALDEAAAVTAEPAIDLLALDEALDGLSKIDTRKARMVELRYFGGLSVDETAEVLRVSPATVLHDWTLAKAWLRRAMSGTGP